MEGQKFSRYCSLVSSLATPALQKLSPPAPGSDPGSNPGEASLGIAIPAARLLLADDAALHEGLASGLEQLATCAGGMLADSGGDRRDVYYPFALHLHLTAFNNLYESLPVGLWSRCDEALAKAAAPAREVETFATQPPGCNDVARVLWDTLCLYELAHAQQRDTDVEWLDSVVHQVIENPGDDGSLHAMDESESMELWTYRELCGLHALANLALRRRNDGWAKRVAAIVAHHEANTQPDFTTTQPWGVFAFVWTGEAMMFADQQLHDAQHAGGGTLQLIAALLLADAADALRTFK